MSFAFENDIEWDRQRAESKAIKSYKTLKEKDPLHDLLKFGNIFEEGVIFKKEKMEFTEEHHKEYLDKYAPGKKMYPLSIDSYAEDMEKVVETGDYLKKIKADLHEHWRTPSKIKENDFNNIVNTAHKRLGKGGIVGLVNFEDNRYEAITRLKGYSRENLGNAVYVPEKEITLIRGQEIPTKEGHLLSLALPEDLNLPSGEPIKETVKRIRDNNGIVVVDHPFYFEGIGGYLSKNQETLEDIDALEVWNASACFGIAFTPLKINANKMALEFFNSIKNNFPYLGGLCVQDGHSKYEFARSYSVLEDISRENSETISNSLRSSIRQHRNFEDDKRAKYFGKIGAIDHITNLILILGYEKISSRIKD